MVELIEAFSGKDFRIELAERVGRICENQNGDGRSERDGNAEGLSYCLGGASGVDYLSGEAEVACAGWKPRDGAAAGSERQAGRKGTTGKRPRIGSGSTRGIESDGVVEIDCAIRETGRRDHERGGSNSQECSARDVA